MNLIFAVLHKSTSVVMLKTASIGRLTIDRSHRVNYVRTIIIMYYTTYGLGYSMHAHVQLDDDITEDAIF